MWPIGQIKYRSLSQCSYYYVLILVLQECWITCIHLDRVFVQVIALFSKPSWWFRDNLMSMVKEHIICCWNMSTNGWCLTFGSNAWLYAIILHIFIQLGKTITNSKEFWGYFGQHFSQGICTYATLHIRGSNITWKILALNFPKLTAGWFPS